jgi:hypothetical protein
MELAAAAAAAEATSAHGEDEAGVQRSKSSRIVTLGLGTARPKMALERWTHPKPQRRACSPRYWGTIV